MPQSIDEILEQTLADYQLSRGERRAMKMVLEDLKLDGDRLAWLRHRAFDLARDRINDPQAQRVVDWLEEVVKALLPEQAPAATPSRAYFRPGDNCMRKLCGLILAARSRIDVCVFTITDDRIAAELLDAHRRGVALRIVSDNDKSRDLGSDVEDLRAAGVPVRVDHSQRHMHHKFALFDGVRLVTGSYNWTRDAAKNMENMIVTSDESLVGAFAVKFEEIWQTLAN